MCLGGSKSPPPPPPPPPPAPPAPVPELKTSEDTMNKDDPTGSRKGRRKLRIDQTSTTGGASEGSGLNIPTA